MTSHDALCIYSQQILKPANLNYKVHPIMIHVLHIMYNAEKSRFGRMGTKMNKLEYI